MCLVGCCRAAVLTCLGVGLVWVWAAGDAVLSWAQVYPAGGKETHTIQLTGKKAKGSAVITTTIKSPPPAAASGAGAAAAASEVVQIPKHACKAVLTKGLGLKIADCSDDVVDVFTMGLAWDVTNGVNIDLDARCVAVGGSSRAAEGERLGGGGGSGSAVHQPVGRLVVVGSCIVLDAELRQVDLVFFSNLTSSDGAIKHSGDEREGDEKGDDESITVRQCLRLG